MCGFPNHFHKYIVYNDQMIAVDFLSLNNFKCFEQYIIFHIIMKSSVILISINII